MEKKYLKKKKKIYCGRGENPITNCEEGPALGSRGRPREWGRGYIFPLGIRHGHISTVQAAPCFPCSPSPSVGLLKGRWARVVGGLFFTQGSGRTPNCSACFLPSSSPCLLQSLPACSCPTRSTPTLPFFPRAPCPSSSPGDLFCFLLCFFFCFECLSLQVSVAGRSRSQWLQCKFPIPLGKCTTLFWGVLGCFCFSGVFVLFYFFLYLFFPFIWREWEEVGTGRWEVDFVYFFNSFPGDGNFFLK